MGEPLPERKGERKGDVAHFTFGMVVRVPMHRVRLGKPTEEVQNLTICFRTHGKITLVWRQRISNDRQCLSSKGVTKDTSKTPSSSDFSSNDNRVIDQLTT